MEQIFEKLIGTRDQFREVRSEEASVVIPAAGTDLRRVSLPVAFCLLVHCVM